MSRRGRRSGYKNFSVAEQILLCSVTEAILPLGRDHWEQVALRYNARRPRGTCERDFEALRRKFRSMYSKPKPSGINGEIPESKKAIAMAQEIHYAIEKKGSVTLHHDGVDDGGDDDVLVRHVDALTSGRRVQPTPPSDLASDAENEGEPVVRNKHVIRNETPSSARGLIDSEGEDAASIYEAAANTEEDDVAAGEDLRWPGDSDPQVIDTDALISTHISTHNGTNYDPEQPHPEASLAEETNQFETTTEAPEVDNFSDIRQERGNSASAHSKRSSGRPRRSSHEIIPSQASHDGPLLPRDPSKASADTEEMARYRGLATVSNRLGGRDLRILRDNFEDMGGRPKTPGSKRTSVEANNTPTYASNKRFNARKRLESLESSVSNAFGDLEKSNNNDIINTMSFFQRQADLRAEQEERKRREDREDRELRMKEAKRKEDADRAERESARQESQRRFDARMEADRAEGRERHQQMMLLLTSLITKGGKSDKNHDDATE